ncbi:nuclear pore complex protein NUP1-like [Musa acuminata AAA Group]|uniref:nuclear pore complex protein NUP1-like n=1 Tax=Musa acuminata AAA Group TaxID=214697 RepID=UPI0031DFA9EA
METPDYEGGIGGKIRRRPLRRAAATPYDRPPTPARGLVVQPSEPGWLSKLVDPASRLITSSASKLFSCVLRKRLPAPSVDGALGEEGFQSGQEGVEAAFVELSAELQENKADCENNATNNSDSNKVMEFEQLIKQKTFTRDQFEHLTGILHSRILDSDLPKPDKKLVEMTVPLPAKDIESSRPHDDITTPANVQAIDDQTASPVELAKAYMGSKFPSVSPSSLRWHRRHIFQEHKTVPCNSTYATKPFDLKGPRSVVRFSGSAEIPDSVTPTSHDISAMYGMSCSPYYKGEGSSKKGNAGLLPFQTPETTRQLGGRQVLKRRSSVLDDDFGSYGSIRRIRQKVATMTPSKKVRHLFLSGNRCLVPSTPFKKDVQDDSSLNQEPNCLDQQQGGNRISDSAVAFVLPQSKQIENKIFQQLDKLVPLSKEKSPKIKDYPLDGSPANKHAFSKGISNSSFYKQETVNVLGENGPSTSISGVKSVSEADTMQKQAIKMSTPEDTQVNNMDALMDPSCQLKNGDEVKKSPEKPVRSSVIRTEGFPPRTSASIPSSSSDFSKAADVKPLNDIVVNNGKGFTFPFASAPSISQPPSTPTVATPLVEKTVAQKGESVFPLFSFGSEDSNRLEFSSATTMGSSNATSGLKNSTSNATTSALKGSISDRGEGQITGNLSRSVGLVDSLDKSTMNNSIVFSFGNSCNESFPNGSLSSSSTSASVMTLPGRTASLIFSTTASALASSSSSSSSSVAQIFSTVPSLLFGSTSSMVSTTSVPQSLAESNATNLEGSPLSINCASPGATANFKFGGNSSTMLTADYQFSRADSNPVLAASTVPSISSTVSAASTLFSGSNSNQSAVAPTSTFSGASNSNQSAVVPTSTLSSASNSSQSAVAPTSTFSGLAFGAPTSGSSPFVFGSSSPPVFSFGSAGANSSSISSAHTAFGSQNSAVGFSPGTPGNDQMNVKDSMAEDPNQSAVGTIPPFGQPGTSSSLPVFGAPATQSASSVFQFGVQQNSSLPPGPAPFQAAGSHEFPQGGSFSLGTGGGDKSGRRIVRVKRDRSRKK